MSNDQIKTKYYYHLTTTSNLQGIIQKGIVPYSNKGKFCALSPELFGKAKLKKIFLLPNIYGVGIRGFLSEWWHGELSDIVIIRIPYNEIKGIHQSNDNYYAKHEAWTFNRIPIDRCVYKYLKGDCNRWVKF